MVVTKDSKTLPNLCQSELALDPLCVCVGVCLGEGGHCLPFERQDYPVLV